MILLQCQKRRPCLILSNVRSTAQSSYPRGRRDFQLPRRRDIPALGGRRQDLEVCSVQGWWSASLCDTGRGSGVACDCYGTCVLGLHVRRAARDGRRNWASNRWTARVIRILTISRRREKGRGSYLSWVMMRLLGKRSSGFLRRMVGWRDSQRGKWPKLVFEVVLSHLVTATFLVCI